MPRQTENTFIQEDEGRHAEYIERIARVNAWVKAAGYGAKAKLAYGIGSSPAHTGQILDHPETRVSMVTLQRMESYIAEHPAERKEAEPT